MTQGHTERLEAALDGKYHIERKLGEGGMASVYLAEDIKHRRKVALKILKPELAAVIGADRFLAEIQTTANLQHPHILSLFDSGEADGYLYYVMPFIDGETLRQKLDREKQLAVDESVRIATDVADALDYAHRAGVIHRDIKPGNILLHDGRPVVADFGIAIAVSAAGGGRMTETGLSLGTPHYMSPEQASADRDLSARSDIYSLGCVLYEMIAGQPPHTGPSAQSILVRIMTKEAPPLTELRHTVPPHVAATVSKSIEKLPADRFETAKSFMEALGDEAFTYRARPLDATGTQESVVVPAGAPARPWLRDGRSVAALSLGLVMTALAVTGWLGSGGEVGLTDVVRFAVVPPAEAPFSFQGNLGDLAISPDGRRIIYKGPDPGGSMPALYLRSLDENETAPLRGSEGGLDPFVSPDGEWVGFVDYRGTTTLKRVSILGGAAVTLAVASEPIVGADWGEDDQIVFGTGVSGLFRVPGGGGEPEALTALDEGDGSHRWPSMIDGRGAVVFTIAASGGAPATTGQLAVLDLESGDVTRLGLEGVSPRYVPTGHLVYAASDQSVRAVAFDVRSLTVTGSTVPLLEGVAVKASGASNFDVSDDGRLVYALGGGGGGAERSLLWVDRDGREEAINAPMRGYTYARLSPDDSRLAVDVRGDSDDIWIWDFVPETLTRMLLGDGGSQYPTWTPDGARIAYSGGTSDGSIYWKASNNTGAVETIADPDVPAGVSPYFFTPDGSALVFRDQVQGGDDLVMITLEGDQSTVWRLGEGLRVRNAVLSPDGTWMAYVSNESGRDQIYVRPFPEVETDVVQVSNNGGDDPVWSRDGRELFYLQPGATTQMVSVPLDAGGVGQPFAFGAREVLFEWPYYTGNPGRNYDVAIDGRFLAIDRAGAAAAGGSAGVEISVVLNWFEELRQRIGN
jgi:serine/threonine-protein kinase